MGEAFGTYAEKELVAQIGMSPEDAQTGHNKLRRAKIKSNIIFGSVERHAIMVYVDDPIKNHHYRTLLTTLHVVDLIIASPSSYEKIK